MSPSIALFFSLCILLGVVMAVVVVYPWLRGHRPDDNRLMALNVEVFKNRLSELEDDKNTGLIDQEYYDAQVIDLKRQLISAGETHLAYGATSLKSRAIVIVWVVILSIMAYALVGDRTSVFNLWSGNDRVGGVADELLTGKIDVPPEWAITDSAALISAMQVNVHHNAHDPNRWMRMSELYMSLEAGPQAIESLSRAYRLDSQNEEIASTYANVSFFANEGRLDGTTRAVLAKLLAQSPNHEGAQMLMAMGETRAGNYEEAKMWVARLRSAISAKSGDHSGALASLDELSATIDAQAAKQSQGVTVSVALDNAMLSKVEATDVLFVTVLDAQGGAPYAVQRLPVSEFKDGMVEVRLDDGHAMMPERTISFARNSGVNLVVSARISKSGNAISQSGDLSANPAVLGKTQSQASLTINQEVP